MNNTIVIHIYKTFIAAVLLILLSGQSQNMVSNSAILGSTPQDIPTNAVAVISEDATPSDTEECQEDSCHETDDCDSFTAPSYSEYELDLLARLIHQEAGSDWIPDDIQLWVGSVVLNRVESELFPDTIYDVIYQSGQYAPAITGSIDTPASDRAIHNARYLLENGSVLPSGVIFQSGFEQGAGVYATYIDDILQTTTYFCYG